MNKPVATMVDVTKRRIRHKKKGSRIISAEELRALRKPFSAKAQTIINKVVEGHLRVEQDELSEDYLYGCGKEIITNH